MYRVLRQAHASEFPTGSSHFRNYVKASVANYEISDYIVLHCLDQAHEAATSTAVSKSQLGPGRTSLSMAAFNLSMRVKIGVPVSLSEDHAVT